MAAAEAGAVNTRPIPEGVGGKEYNKLENKPFYVEPNNELIAETAWVFDAEQGAALVVSSAIAKADNLYFVNYNGVQYECICQASPTGVLLLGNVGAFDPDLAPNTGEPFVIVCIGEQGFWGVSPLDGATSGTLSVYDAVVHPLPSIYLPKMTVNFTMVNENAQYNSVADKTLEEIIDAVRKGYDVVGKITMPMGQTTTTAVLCNISLTARNGTGEVEACNFAAIFENVLLSIKYGSESYVGSTNAETPVTVSFKTIA